MNDEDELVQQVEQAFTTIRVGSTVCLKRKPNRHSEVMALDYGECALVHFSGRGGVWYRLVDLLLVGQPIEGK
jgi:hypothetical protein